MSQRLTDDFAKGRHILIIGDIIIDHYLVGKVERISPEAPVPVVLHEEERYCLGGAANVALNIQALGATPHLLSVVGQDQGHQQLVQLLQAANLHHYLLNDASRRTTLKTRVMARQQQLLRYDYEDTHPINEALQQQVLARVRSLVKEQAIDAIVFQDYNKGLFTPPLIQQLITLAKAEQIPTLADPKKAHFLAYKGVDWFKPNLREINDGLSLHIDERSPSTAALKAATALLEQQLNNRHTVVTLGAKGLYATAPQRSEWFPTKARAIADVCGAGDTVISLLATGVAAQLEWSSILTLANIAGGQVCERLGVVAVDRQALLREFAEETG